MYTRLQNLRQGSRSVDEYAEEFALLLTRNEIHDSQIQLVSRFIGGLRSQLQTAMAQFDPSTVGEAHRRAASLEQQSHPWNWTSLVAQILREATYHLRQQRIPLMPPIQRPNQQRRKNNNDDVQLDLMLCAVTHVENRGTVRQIALMHHDGD